MIEEMQEAQVFESEPEVQPEIVLDRGAMLTELLEYCGSFIDRSAEWRRTSFEDQWARWQRAVDAIYDPELAAKKASWMSKAVWPITASHVESIVAQLFRTEVGPRPPVEYKGRNGVVSAEEDQSTNIRDLVLREREKSRYEVERNKMLIDKGTHGSGFARLRFEERKEPRKIKVPVFEEINLDDPTSVQRSMLGQQSVVGYRDEIREVTVYRGCVFEHISIWDVFPDPKALKIQGSSIAYRYETTFGDVLKGVQAGYYLQEGIARLRGVDSEETTPSDRQVVESDRQIADVPVKRTEYGKVLRCYELFARLPKKWVLINGEEIDDPEALISAVVRFHKSAVISVSLNDAYDGEPQIYKDDYMTVGAQFYGRGIPEMLKDIQLVSTETVNQRLDAGSIALSQKFGVIEKALVDPKDIDENRNVIRFKNPSGITDIKQMMMTLDMGRIDSAAFIEPQEWERIAQERTSANRVTLGNAGQVKDANQTLGGMEILKQSAGEKFAYIGMVSEFDFQYEIARAYYRLIYSNYTPEDVALALGMERAQTWRPISPEEVEMAYQYVPQGVYTMENKALRQSRLAQIDAQFGMLPYFKRVELARDELKDAELDPDRYIRPEAEAMEMQMQAQQMAQQMLSEAVEKRKIEKSIATIVPEEPMPKAKKGSK